MPDRSADWISQAQRDLEHAQKDVTDRYFEHACFEAQQAAEKAVKGLYMRFKAEAWIRRVGLLLEELPLAGIKTPTPLIDDAKILDQYYVTSRYPNQAVDLTGRDFGVPSKNLRLRAQVISPAGQTAFIAVLVPLE
ncbi:MAG: HEPN domain-containing protein, partial [Spirochaetia bacterium]